LRSCSTGLARRGTAYLSDAAGDSSLVGDSTCSDVSQFDQFDGDSSESEFLALDFKVL
jgi:hypothetical protein